MLGIKNTDESIERNNNHIQLPSISSILTWHTELNPSTTSLSSILTTTTSSSLSSSSSSFHLPYQYDHTNPSTTSLNSENTLPPLLSSHSSSSSSLSSQFNQQQQHHISSVNYHYNDDSSFYTPSLNQSNSTFVFKPKLSTYPMNENINININNNDSLTSTRKIRRSKRSKLLSRTFSMVSLSGNLKSQPSTSSLSASITYFQSDHPNNLNLNPNHDNNNNNSNDIIEDITMVDNDNDNDQQSMSISSSSTTSSTSNVSNPLIKPRWKENERLNLLKAIVKEKQLDDMASFSWDKIALVVGRAKKACKDQWRREVLPALMKNYQ
ncbi:unnamed protein product [Cunninghamella blakesleeana]